MYEIFEYLNLTQLGEIFGVSGKKLGRILVEIGLRTKGKEPSKRASEKGFVRWVDDENCGGFYAWHGEKTIAALEAAGYRRVDTVKPDVSLVGPFKVQAEGGRYEIITALSEVCFWAADQNAANRLVVLLNLADRYGKFGGEQSQP